MICRVTEDIVRANLDCTVTTATDTTCKISLQELRSDLESIILDVRIFHSGVAEVSWSSRGLHPGQTKTGFERTRRGEAHWSSAAFVFFCSRGIPCGKATQNSSSHEDMRTWGHEDMRDMRTWGHEWAVVTVCQLSAVNMNERLSSVVMKPWWSDSCSKLYLWGQEPVGTSWDQLGPVGTSWDQPQDGFNGTNHILHPVCMYTIYRLYSGYVPIDKKYYIFNDLLYTIRKILYAVIELCRRLNKTMIWEKELKLLSNRNQIIYACFYKWAFQMVDRKCVQSKVVSVDTALKLFEKSVFGARKS